MTKTLIAPSNTFSIAKKTRNTVPVNTDAIEAMTPDTDKKVYGTFVNIEYPGQPAKICGKYYKGMEYFAQVMEDNQKYTIPLSVARWINERIVFEEHSYILDEKGNQIKNPKPRARYKFLIESMAA